MNIKELIKKEDLVQETIKFNTDISIIKIEEFLEFLEDKNCLNNKGIELRNILWEIFIKSEVKD